jgi:hypothetical protein
MIGFPDGTSSIVGLSSQWLWSHVRKEIDKKALAIKKVV